MPVFPEASLFTSSHKSRGNMQLSTTTMARRVTRSSSTRHRACNESTTLLSLASRKPPLRITGSVRGVTSTLAAPALSSARASAGNNDMVDSAAMNNSGFMIGILAGA